MSQRDQRNYQVSLKPWTTQQFNFVSEVGFKSALSSLRVTNGIQAAILAAIILFACLLLNTPFSSLVWAIAFAALLVKFFIVDIVLCPYILHRRYFAYVMTGGLPLFTNAEKAKLQGAGCNPAFFQSFSTLLESCSIKWNVIAALGLATVLVFATLNISYGVFLAIVTLFIWYLLIKRPQNKGNESSGSLSQSPEQKIMNKTDEMLQKRRA